MRVLILVLAPSVDPIPFEDPRSTVATAVATIPTSAEGRRTRVVTLV